MATSERASSELPRVAEDLQIDVRSGAPHNDTGGGSDSSAPETGNRAAQISVHELIAFTMAPFTYMLLLPLC